MNQGVVTCAYLIEVLQVAFPTKNVLNGTFNMRALEPFRPGDLVDFGGKVLDTGDKRLLSSYVFNLNGVGFQDPGKLKLCDGDALLILPSQAGG